MKATVEIPNDLYRETKVTAAMRGVKVKDLVAEGLRLVLRGERAQNTGRRLKFPLVDTGQTGSQSIPDDAAAHLEKIEDLERHAVSG